MKDEWGEKKPFYWVIVASISCSKLLTGRRLVKYLKVEKENVDQTKTRSDGWSDSILDSINIISSSQPTHFRLFHGS